MPERIRTSPPKCLYKKAMKRNRTENLKKQIKKSPQAIADSKKNVYLCNRKTKTGKSYTASSLRILQGLIAAKVVGCSGAI